MDCSPQGYSVHGISQATILVWVAIPFPMESSRPRDQTRVSCVSCIDRQILYHQATKNAPIQPETISKTLPLSQAPCPIISTIAKVTLVLPPETSLTPYDPAIQGLTSGTTGRVFSPSFTATFQLPFLSQIWNITSVPNKKLKNQLRSWPQVKQTIICSFLDRVIHKITAQNLTLVRILLLSCSSGPPWRPAALPLICLVPVCLAKPSVHQVQVTLSLVH